VAHKPTQQVWSLNNRGALLLVFSITATC